MLPGPAAHSSLCLFEGDREGIAEPQAVCEGTRTPSRREHLQKSQAGSALDTVRRHQSNCTPETRRHQRETRGRDLCDAGARGAGGRGSLGGNAGKAAGLWAEQRPDTKAPKHQGSLGCVRTLPSVRRHRRVSPETWTDLRPRDCSQETQPREPEREALPCGNGGRKSSLGQRGPRDENGKDNQVGVRRDGCQERLRTQHTHPGLRRPWDICAWRDRL